MNFLLIQFSVFVGYVILMSCIYKLIINKSNQSMFNIWVGRVFYLYCGHWPLNLYQQRTNRQQGCLGYLKLNQQNAYK